MMKSGCIKKLLAALLCLCMTVSLLPTRFAAAEEIGVPEPESGEAAAPVRDDGEETYIAADDETILPGADWNELYPFGTFAFGNHQADIAEPGATADGQEIPQSLLIPVYRFGGTVGRVTAQIHFMPAVTKDVNGEEDVFDYAASGKTDLLIEIEDPNPIAQYQPLGISDAEKNIAASELFVTLAEHPDTVLETDEIRLILSGDAQADSYRWQANDRSGWQDIVDADGTELPVLWSDLWDFGEEEWTGMDFRCIYEKDGALFATASLLGEVYASPYTDPDPVPADLVIPEKNTFTALTFADEYDGCDFELTFADGETVKYIRVTALDDEIPELPEIGLFTITGCEGGTLTDTCNTLMLMISDNDAKEPSELGFSAETVAVDRAEGVARIKVVRTGGKSYTVSVHYATENGTALAGIDYAKTEGDLAFAGEIDEIEITVPLITNFETEDKTFSLVLSDVRGGGTDKLCTLSTERVEVTLFGSATQADDEGAGQNLATVLSGDHARDASDSVQRSGEALIQVEQEAEILGSVVMPQQTTAEATLVLPNQTRLHQLPGYYKFTRQQLLDVEATMAHEADANYFWRDYDDILGAGYLAYGSGLDSLRSYTQPVTWTVDPDSGTTGINFDVGWGRRSYGTYEDLDSTGGEVRGGSGGGYMVTKVDTNYRGQVRSNWNDSYQPGDYYDQLLISFGWARPGVRKTSWIESDCHRYLRPEITVSVGSWKETRMLDVDTSTKKAETIADSWEAYCRVKDHGNWQKNWASRYNHEYHYSSPEGPDLSFGDSFKIEFDFQFYNTWTHDKAKYYDKALTESDMKQQFDIRNVSGHRRVFKKTGRNGITLKIYTANDKNNSAQNDFVQIDETSELYSRLAPVLSIVPEQGGVDQDGNIYVGTKLKIDCSGIKGNFTIPQDGVFIENGDHKIVGKLEADSGKSNVWYCTMIWNGIGESDLNQDYSLCVYFNRKQNIEINMSHAISPESTDVAGDLSRAWAAFRENAVTVKKTDITKVDGKLTFRTVEQTWEPDQNDAFSASGTSYTLSNINNIQTVCFHQDPDDVIVYDGRGYAGNAEIPLAKGDLTSNTLLFVFYSAEFLNTSSIMETFIDRVEVYYDRNGDGVISGTLSDDNMFILDVDENGQPLDTFVEEVAGDYPDAQFAPVLDDAGVLHQHFFKVYLRMSPRSLGVPSGYTGDEKAQLLPAFVTAVTDASEAAKLTDEQRMYRYIRGFGTDNLPMFGEAVYSMRTIDIPLGGDVGTLRLNSVSKGIFDENGELVDIDTKNVFTWEPDFRGNLLVNFDSPTPILDTRNATGGEVPLAGENPALNADGTFAYSAEGLSKLNGYLGSFTGRTTFAVGVQEQAKPTRAANGADAIGSFSDLNPESVTIGGVRSIPNADNMTGLVSAGDPGETQGTSPETSDDTADFKQDFGTKLPSLDFSIGSKATLIMDGYKVGFAVSLPMYKNGSKKTFGGETVEQNYDGSTTTTWTDENGNVNVQSSYTTEYGDQVTSTVVTAYDSADPDTRVKTLTTETVDADGHTDYRQEVRTETRDSNGTWVYVDSTVSDTKPELSRGQKFKKDTGIESLESFCTACATRDASELSKFMSGQMKDDSYNAAKNGRGATMGRSVSFTVQFAIMFEYNPIDDCHYFKSAGLSGILGLNFSLQMRFTPFPLAYLYMKVGVKFKLSLSLTCYRIAKYGDALKDADFVSGDYSTLAEKNGEAVFKLDMRDDYAKVRGFVFDVKGKVIMEIYDNAELSGNPLNSGALSGNGSDQETLLKAYDKEVYIKLKQITDAEPATISKIRPITGADSKVRFNGATLEPSLSIEVGIGLGIEVLKIEAFLRFNTSIAFTMGGYLPETDSYEGFYISSFKGSITIGLNISLIFIDYTLDALAFGFTGKQHGTRGYFDWHISCTALDGNYELWSTDAYTSADGHTLDGKPEPPNGINIFKDNPDIRFYKKDGTAVDLSDNASKNQGWTFRTDVLAWRWSGGDFLGEVPQNSDLAEADENGVFIKFTPEKPKIKLYFSGTIQVYKGASDTTGTTYKSSPATIEGCNDEVKVVLKEGAKLDRYHLVDNRAADAVPEETRSASRSLVHISEPKDVSKSQTILTPEADSRAITPTGTEDFELSGYNTTGDARRLVGGLTTGYDYLLVPAGEENYILYPYQIDGVPQLVLSKLVMTDSFADGTGLVHPITGGADPAYLVLDDDSCTDLSFDAVGTADGIRVVWVTANGSGEAGYSVKQRDIPLTEGAALPATVTLSTGEDPCMLPAAESAAAVWVSASGDGTRINNLLKAWLRAKNDKMTDEVFDHPDQVSDPDIAVKAFQWATLSSLNAFNGDESVLHVRVGDTVAEDTITGEHVTNLETATVGDRVYILYSTAQVVYFDTTLDVPVTVGPDDMDKATERSTVHRLYLRTADRNGFSDAVCIETVVDHDGCDRDTLDSARLKDGIYANGSLLEAQADPYFANLRFVNAELDGNGAQTAAFFEMGGNTWLLTEADMNTLLGGSGTVTLTPIFSETTGTDVAIGSDGRNLAIVYTAAVDNSLSNAIFISWWDKNVESWGNPTILAMRGLQIYEDRITYDMTPEEAEKAYFGELTTAGGHTGSNKKLTFSNLQMSRATIDHDGKTADQLIILATGAMSEYMERTFHMSSGDDYTTKVPNPDVDTALGFYAIGFGMGEQTIGEGDLDFSAHDFTVGSRLSGEVSFRNTGTAAIRASDANPMTIRLMVTAGIENSPAQEIAQWKLSKSIPSGKQTTLYFEGAALAHSLREGAAFYLEVEEDAYFAENYHGTIHDLFTIQARPELSISSFDLKLTRIKNGVATFALDATVVNNGSADAEDTFMQFSYDTGEVDAFGNRIYYPIDITGSVLETGVMTPLRVASMQDDFENGIYHLEGSDGTRINSGYYRTVSGDLCVPIECFVNKEDISGLHIKAEIYCSADTPNYLYGVYGSDHADYNDLNNKHEETVKHQTLFSVPGQIATALGTTLILPVSFEATDSQPDLLLTEISDGTPDWSPRMGVCYYDAQRKVIVAAPNSTAQEILEAGGKPTGILQLKDMATNTIEAITYRIDSMAQGVNIYRDDASFTFYDANGDPTDLYTENSENTGWSFLDKGVAVGWTGGDPGEVPMNHDLCLANQEGAFFTFNTVADTMTFCFMGQLTVESSLFGTSTLTSSPATVAFDNPTGAFHTLKVTAKAGTKIDRYVATYQNNPVVEPDPDEPQVLWNRSFPDVASVQDGFGVPMTCYITDESGVLSVSFNDVQLSESTTPALVKLSNKLWYFNYTFQKNGVYEISVTDIVGNSGESHVTVGWFNSVISAGAIADAPELSRSNAQLTDPDGLQIDMNAAINRLPWLTSTYELGEDEQSKLLSYTDGAFPNTPLSKDGGERWLIEDNGIYQLRVDRANGTWARVIVLIDGIDRIPPELSARLKANQIRITAVDNKSIAKVTVNQYPLPITGGDSYMGAYDVSFTGDYTVAVSDAAGNTTRQVIHADIPLAINNVETDVSCPNGEVCAHVTVKRSDIVGGRFDEAYSVIGQNIYDAKYEIALAPAGTTTAPANGWTAVNDTCTLTVAEGDYELFVRNSLGETARYASTLHLHHLSLGSRPAYVWTETETGWSVTATHVCGNDATHTETETVEATCEVLYDATCDEDGLCVYTATFENDEFTTQTKYVTIPAFGHVWGEPSYEWIENEEVGYLVDATATCLNDPTHHLSERVVAACEVTVPVTYLADGEIRYTATFETEQFTEQTKTVVIPMLTVTLRGETVTALDQYVTENGERLYPYPIRVENLPDGKLGIDSAQIFLTYDHDALAIRRSEGAVDWTLTDNGGVLSATWASDAETEIRDGDAVLTLYFVRVSPITEDETIAIGFTESALGSGSAVSYVENGRVTELVADTVDGEIRFEAPIWGDANCDGKVTSADAALILRAVVGLSTLTVRGAFLADVDGDGEATAADAVSILRYVVGLIDALPLA